MLNALSRVDRKLLRASEALIESESFDFSKSDPIEYRRLVDQAMRRENPFEFCLR